MNQLKLDVLKSECKSGNEATIIRILIYIEMHCDPPKALSLKPVDSHIKGQEESVWFDQNDLTGLRQIYEPFVSL